MVVSGQSMLPVAWLSAFCIFICGYRFGWCLVVVQLMLRGFLTDLQDYASGFNKLT